MRNPQNQETNLDVPRKSVRITGVNTEKHKEDWLGEKVGRAILPAQKTNSESNFDPPDGELISVISRLAEHKELFKFNAERFYVALNDNSQLDTLEIKAESASKFRGYIINFLENNQNYTHIGEQDLLSDLENFNCIYFNYRNVGKSQGNLYACQDLFNDGIAQIQRLIDSGIPSDLIYLYGFSLGGAVSAKVFEHFLNKGILLGFCFNDRSFNNLNTATEGSIKYISKISQVSLLGNPVVSAVIGNIAKAAITNTQWQINAQHAFSAIPEERKAGAYVEWQHPKNVVGGDGIISDDAIMRDETVQKYDYSGEYEAHNAHYSALKNKDGKNPKEIFYEACIKRREWYLTAIKEFYLNFESLEQSQLSVVNPDNKLSLNKRLSLVQGHLISLDKLLIQLKNTNFVDLHKKTMELKHQIVDYLNNAYFSDAIAKLKDLQNIDKCLPLLINLHKSLKSSTISDQNTLPITSAIEKILFGDGLSYLEKIDLDHFFENYNNKTIDQLSSIVMNVHEMLANNDQYIDSLVQFNQFSQKFYEKYSVYCEQQKTNLNNQLMQLEEMISTLTTVPESKFTLQFVNQLENIQQSINAVKQAITQNQSSVDDNKEMNDRLGNCESIYLAMKKKVLASLKEHAKMMIIDEKELQEIRLVATYKNKIHLLAPLTEELQSLFMNYYVALIDKDIDKIATQSHAMEKAYRKINELLGFDQSSVSEAQLSRTLLMHSRFCHLIADLDLLANLFKSNEQISGIINDIKNIYLMTNSSESYLKIQPKIDRHLLVLYNFLLDKVDALTLPMQETKQIRQLLKNKSEELQKILNQRSTVQLEVQGEVSHVKLRATEQMLKNSDRPTKPQRSPRDIVSPDSKYQKS